jgi:hypothetical protein
MSRSSIKWIKYHPDEEHPPTDVPLLVTDGKNIFIGQLWGLSKYRDKEKWGEWGFGGYEWDWNDLELEKMWDHITHWAYLPELPMEGL